MTPWEGRFVVGSVTDEVRHLRGKYFKEVFFVLDEHPEHS